MEQLLTQLKEWEEPSFRAKQIQEWLWQHGVRNIEEMTNLSKSLREKLSEHYMIHPPEVDLKQVSEDGTIKMRFLLPDNYKVEGVLIPADERMTACVSSQVGCSLTCSFCATGQMKRERNLTPAEIYDQVMVLNQTAQDHYKQNLSNIVFMGMGEPLLNYKNVFESIEHLTSEEGRNIASKRITVSTAGIAKMIKRMADEDRKVKLALSLHAANDEKRDKIMPINEQNSLQALKDALRYYFNKTRIKLTYEYILFDNFNDGIQDARELYEFSKVVPCKINLIEYNKVEGVSLNKAKANNTDEFRNYLQERGVIQTYRQSRGKDIDAACGQLANK